MQEIAFNPLAKSGDDDYGLLYIGVGDGGSAENGYPFTEAEQEEIREGGEFNYDIVKRLQFEDMHIIMLNSWSGHDFVIGYHVDADNKKAHKKFAKYFPKVKSQYHDFTEVC